MTDPADAALKLAGVEALGDLDRVAADLHALLQLLTKWQRVQNLVSRETLDQYWSRHVADSLQLLHLTRETDRIGDLGSGGGFPALPMAIAARGSDREFVLIESNQRKVSFLRAAARAFDLNVKVIAKRIGDTVSRETGNLDVITARALAPMPVLCGYAYRFWSPDTRALFLKGREHVDELAESAAIWHHDVILRKSATDPQAAVVDITNLRPRS